MIVCFIGMAGSGKTTASEYFMRVHNFKLRLSFASPLKDIYKKMNPLYSESNKGLYRSELQNLGDDIKKQNPNYFVDVMRDKIKGALTYTESSSMCICIDDMRFPEEYEMLKTLSNEYGFRFVVIKLKYTKNFVFPLMSDSEKTHNSEMFKDAIPFDYEIVSDGYETLYKKLDEIIHDIKMSEM